MLAREFAVVLANSRYVILTSDVRQQFQTYALDIAEAIIKVTNRREEYADLPSTTGSQISSLVRRHRMDATLASLQGRCNRDG